MSVFILILVAAVCMAGGGITASRRARLKRLARRTGGVFCRRREELVTAPNAEKLELFSGFVCSFQNVITRKDPAAFTRLADMTAQDKNGHFLPPFTVFSAERLSGGWPALKIAPAAGPFTHSRLTAVKTKNENLNAAYRIFLSSPQAARLLTAPLQRRLEQYPNIYMEIYENVFVYHEGRLIPPAEAEAFRLRALARMAEISAADKSAATAPQIRAAHLPEETPDEKVLALLAAARPAPYTPQSQSGGFGAWKAVLLLLILLVLPFIAYYISRRFPH